MDLRDCSFVVVDCETTGFHPGYHHRMIELALVPVSCDGVVGEPWCTLLQPGRDLGPTDVHGIRGRDLLDAPTFEAVVGHVVDHVAGRVIVAHNAVFDCTFLEAEFARAGIPAPPLPSLCTMRLAHHLGMAGGRGRLSDCCAIAGVSLEQAHTAEADALACAALFSSWLPALRSHSATPGSNGLVPWPAEAWPTVVGRAGAVRRTGVHVPVRAPDFLAGLVEERSGVSGRDAAEAAAYLELLDRALEDRMLSVDEQADLGQMASLLGLTRERAGELHADYLATLVAVALRDGVITEREHADLELVADALGIDGLDSLTAACEGANPQVGAASLAGKTVCFTGALVCEYEGQKVTRELAQHLAEQAGLIAAPRVTKALDLLVVADPHSLSGKARKAQAYGTRIVAETAFWSMLGVEVA